MEEQGRLRIAVVIGTAMSCYREAVRGVNSFAIGKQTWHIDLVSPTGEFLADLRDLRPDGIMLGPVDDDWQCDAARELAPAIVGLVGQHSQHRPSGMPEVEADDAEVGRLAAKYFLEKGYRQLAFVGTHGAWADRRRSGFIEQLRATIGVDVAWRQYEDDQPDVGSGWERPPQGVALMDWLRALPRPLAVFICNDLRGRQLAEACLDAGIPVPDDVALLGVDNDDLECELSHPPLSSVQIPWRQAGYQAASLLDRMMSGQAVPHRQHLVAPTCVVERQSTDALSIADPDVAAALGFIRRNAHRPIGVDEVMREVPTARRSLERRFRTVAGRTMLDEIRRVHVEAAKRLLASTELSMPEVAEKSGFISAPWFSKTFRQLTDQSPTEYRQQFRNR